MIPRPIYREWSGPSPSVDKLWRLTVPADICGPTQHRVLPDGCMDLVVHLHRTGSGKFAWGNLQIAGPSTGAALVEVRPGDVFFGVRYLPGWGRRCLGVDPQGLTGQIARASEVDRRYASLESELAESVAAGRMHATFRAILRRTQTVAPAGRAQVAVERIRTSRGHIDLRRLAGELSISPRTLRREVAAEAGVPPKALARVFRFRYALTCSSPSLAMLAAAAGYADQAHMTREFAVLAGLSPARWMAETFKTWNPGEPTLTADQERLP